MERWLNKVAVVTGASSGIGKATCTALLERGLIVVGLDCRYERMEAEYKPKLPRDQQKRFYAKKCDVTNEADILTTFKWIDETLGGVDVLVNSAGIIRQTQLVAENNTADLKATLEVNVLGVALCTREAFLSMKRRGFDGHVVIINSVIGHVVPKVPGQTLNMYPSSKYALTAMTEVLRQEFLLNETKVKVTSISPGVVDTEIMTDDFRKLIAEGAVPCLKPEDVADAVVYCIQTPPHVQIHELTIRPICETF